MESPSNTILVKGDPVQKEGTAKGAINPGMLVSIATDSPGGALINYEPAAAGAISRNFVRERDWIGEGTDATIPTGDRVESMSGRPGDEVYARIAPGGTLARARLRVASAANGPVCP